MSAPGCPQDNLANELVKGPLVTRPGLPSAHLGNSAERRRASCAGPPSVAAGGANPRTLGPYIKIISRRNRWPVRTRGRIWARSRRRAGRGTARPGVGRSGRRAGSREGGGGPRGSAAAAGRASPGGRGVPGQNRGRARGRLRGRSEFAHRAAREEELGRRPAAGARVHACESAWTAVWTRAF